MTTRAKLALIAADLGRTPYFLAVPHPIHRMRDPRRFVVRRISGNYAYGHYADDTFAREVSLSLTPKRIDTLWAQYERAQADRAAAAAQGGHGLRGGR